MAGHKKTKKFAVQKAGAPNSEINVTPLVDVVLVLLIIFMVVTPLLEKDIEVKVPDTQQVETQTEVPQDQLIVSINAAGEFQVNSEKMPSQEEYQEKLKKILARKKKDDKLVFFMPDEKANYAKLVAALDGAKLAGAEILGMMTEIPEGMKHDGAAPAPEGAAVPTTP